MTDHARALVDRLGLQQPVRWGVAGVSSPDQAFALPVGTVTFLLTDVEGSTHLWSTEPAEAMATAIRRHYEILAEAVEREGGVRPQEQGEGDSIVAAFARPSAALAAAIDAQRALAAEPWPTSRPLAVRMAVHTGEVQLRDEYNYAGQAIIRCARLRSLGHGGQVLVSGATRDLAMDQDRRFDFRDLGEHALRDLARPERIHQLVAEGLEADFPAIAHAVPPHNLPTPLSAFVGRQAELAEIRRLIESERLVTLTGAGGVGKTRLALRAAGESFERFPGGITWVELAPVEPGGVAPAVVQALGSPNPNDDPVAVLGRVLGAKRGLIVLDNCEHVIDEASTITHRLLAELPQLHIVATSRSPLDLPGERPWRVPGLSLPADGSQAIDTLSQFDAVRLFVDRAVRAKPNFRIDESNAPTIAELVHRLGGMPLAVELAAARTRTLSPTQILAGLDDALRLLTGGSRAVLPRQQTLEASILWSYQLLSPSEQRMLRGLAVFVDGCTLDAAEAVCAGADLPSHLAFDALDRLVAQSMVTVDGGDLHRFSLLETVRQFAQRVTGVDELAELRGHHAAWFLDEADRLDVLSDTSAIAGHLRAIEVESPNVVGALSWLVREGRTDEAHRLVVRMERPLSMAARLMTVHAMADAVLAASPPPDVHAANHLRFISVFARTSAEADLEGMVTELDALASSFGDDELNATRARLMRDVTLAWTGSVSLDHIDRLVERLAELGDPRRAAFMSMMVTTMASLLGSGRSEVLDRIARFEHGPFHDDPLASGLAAASLAMLDLADGNARAVVQLFEPIVADRFTTVAWASAAALTLGVASLYLPDVDLTDAAIVVGARARAGGEEGLDYAARFLGAVDAVRAGEIEIARELLVGEGTTFDRYTTMLDPPGVLVFGGLGLLPPSNVPGMGKYLAELARQRGDLPKATNRCHALLDFAIEHEWPFLLALGLDDLAAVLADGGQHRDALRILGSVDRFFDERGLTRPPHLTRRRTEIVDAARHVLGDATEEATAEGASLDIAAAATYARRNRASHAASVSGWDALTPTEARVAELVAMGRTNPEVATTLLMGVATVKTHLARIFDKIGVRNRQELVLEAARRTQTTSGGQGPAT